MGCSEGVITKQASLHKNKIAVQILYIFQHDDTSNTFDSILKFGSERYDYILH